MDRMGFGKRSLRDFVNVQHLINYTAEAHHSSDDSTDTHRYSVAWREKVGKVF